MFAAGTGSRRSCCLRALFGKSPRGNSPLGDESLPAARLHCEAAVDRRFRASGARSAEPKRGAGNAVYDPVGQKIGSAEEVFVNRDGEPVYVRVNIGLLFSKTVLIPVQFVETDDEKETIVLK